MSLARRAALALALTTLGAGAETCCVQVAHAQARPTPTVLMIGATDMASLARWYADAGPREFAACVIGSIRGDTLDVDRVAPADVTQSTDSSVTVRPCSRRYPGVVAFLHSHPAGVNCSHYLRINRSLMGEPGHVATDSHVPTSDWWAAHQQAEPVSMIYCGGPLVWMGKDGTELGTDLSRLHPPPEPPGIVTHG